jgi:hypothetical protein
VVLDKDKSLKNSTIFNLKERSLQRVVEVSPSLHLNQSLRVVRSGTCLAPRLNHAEAFPAAPRCYCGFGPPPRRVVSSVASGALRAAGTLSIDYVAHRDVHVVVNPDVNAFALPGGKLAIYTG